MFKIILIVGSILGLGYSIYLKEIPFIILSTTFTIYICYNCYAFIKRRFTIMDDFFEAVKYRDFSRWFAEDQGPEDIRRLYKGFNNVNKTIKDINSQNEAQYVYLQKILEMVNVGIIAYNLDTGEVLWSNDFFNETLSLPSFKNVKFIEKRKPALYTTIFDVFHKDAESIKMHLN